MSTNGVQSALSFLAAARQDRALRSAIEDRGYDVDERELVEIADEAGFCFTPDELQRAYVLDYRMRRARFGGLTRTAEPGSV